MVNTNDILGGLNAICPTESKTCAHAIPAEAGGYAAELADLAAPLGTLGAEDFFYLMVHPEEIESETQGDARAATMQRVQEYLGYAGLNQEGVAVSYEQITVPGKDGADIGSIAVTRITPNNVDDQKAPIVFAGGLFHKTPVYFDFLRQLAILTQREIAAFDSPSVGASQYAVDSQKHGLLAESVPLVIKNIYGDGCPVIVMGHSLGTISARDLFYKQEIQEEKVVNNHIEKYVMIAPVPDLIREGAHGYTMAPSYIWDGLKAVAKNHGALVSGALAADFYFGTKSSDEQDWLLKMTQDLWPISYINYSGVLLNIMRQSLVPHLGEHPKLEVVLMDQDHALPLFRNEDFWRQNALVLSGCHSEIAGRNIDPAYVSAIAALIED